MELEETPSPTAEQGSDNSTAVTTCVHCQGSIVSEGPAKRAVTSCISGQTRVADVLHRKVPHCQFTDSDDNFVCNRCYTVLEKILTRQEEAARVQQEVLQAELELKMLMPALQLQGLNKEQLNTALLDKDNSQTNEDHEVEWFAMLTDSKSQQLVAHCSNRGAVFVEKNWEILKTFPQFCNSYKKERNAQIDHNYSSKKNSGDGMMMYPTTDQQGATEFAPFAPLVPSKSRRKKAVPVKGASAQKSPSTVQQKKRVGRKKRESEVKTMEPSSDTEGNLISETAEQKSCRKSTRSTVQLNLRKRKGIGPDKDKSYSSFAGYSTPKKAAVQNKQNKDFVPSHIDVFTLDHPGNEEVSEKILTTFKKVDPEEPSPETPRIQSKPWACLKCNYVTASRKRTLQHFRLMHDVRDLWTRFHVCQTMPEKDQENEEKQDQYRLQRPFLCVLCGRDYVNKSAEFHIAKDHPGITSKQTPLVIVKKDAGPKLIILYLYGRPPITYLLDSKGRLHEINKIDTSLLKQKVSFTFQEIKPSVPIGIDGETKEEEDRGNLQQYQVEVSMYGCSLADNQPGHLSLFGNQEPNKPADDLSMLRTKLLEKVGIRSGLRTRKTKVNLSNEIDQPRFACKVCHAASNSKNIQEMHHMTHPKQVGKWECTLCGERFNKANLIMDHIGTFHNLLAPQALSHMKAIGVEFSAKLLYDEERTKPLDNEDEGANSTLPDGAGHCEGEDDKVGNENQEAMRALPSTEDMDVWKKQLQELEFCEICCKPMKTDAALMKHMRLAHKIRNYRCPTCSMSFISYSYLLYHMEEAHKPSKYGNYWCTTCNRVFTCRNDFLHHCVNHINDKFRCNICSEVTLSADKLNLHFKTHYPEKALLDTPYVCPICSKVIKERKKVEIHLVTHCITMIEAYRCTMCPKTCVTEKGLRMHMEGHKKNREMVCHICGKVFKRPHRLRDHLRMHENPDPFKCRICQKMVASEDGMKRHIELVHSTTRKKEVVCHLCGKELASNFSLTMHLKLVHNPNKVKRPLKNRQCQYCNKVYVKPYQLTHHIDVHHAGRNFYPCKYCGETFSSRSLYRRHVDIHPEFKPWRCEFCPDKFVFQKTLIDHITKKHPGTENSKVEKRFVCKICGNTYGKLWSLRNHLDVEHNDKRQLGNFEKIRYYCHFCNRGFLYKTGVDIHMAKVHKDEVSVTEVDMIAVEAVAHEETVAAVQAATNDTCMINTANDTCVITTANDGCVIETPGTITLEQEAAVHLLSQLQFQVEQNYVIQ